MSNSYDYWKQFGLEDFAEGFDKLGIRDIFELRENAPYIEKRYHLDGLCELLGVELEQEPDPQPRPVPPPRPVPDPDPTPTPGGGSSAWIIIVVLLVAMTVIAVLMKKTLPPDSSYPAELKVIYEEGTDPAYISDGKVHLVDAANTHDVSEKTFDQYGELTFRLPEGDYDTMYSCDGLAYYLGRWNGKGSHTSTYPFNPNSVMLRALVITFRDGNGNIVKPDSVSVVRGGKAVSCYLLDSGMYYSMVSGGTEDYELSISAEGYSPATISVKAEDDMLLFADIPLGGGQAAVKGAEGKKLLIVRYTAEEVKENIEVSLKNPSSGETLSVPYNAKLRGAVFITEGSGLAELNIKNGNTQISTRYIPLLDEASHYLVAVASKE